MYNGFLDKKLQLKRSSDLKSKKLLKSKSSNNIARTRSLTRVNKWIKNVDQKTVGILAKGSISIIHPSTHQFRTYSPANNVCVKQ